MIGYQKTKWKDLTGTHFAEIVEVEVIPNQYFDPDKDNSTPNVLNITFELIDQETWERTIFTQKFINPLTFGKGIFQQILDVKGFKPEEDGGDFDEQSLVQLKLMVTIGKNKKDFMQLESVAAAPQRARAKVPTKDAEPENVADDLPFP